MGSDLSDRNMMKLGIGFTQETAEEVISPLIVFIDILALLYILLSIVDYVLWGNGFNSLSINESNKSKCYPGALVSLIIYPIAPAHYFW